VPADDPVPSRAGLDVQPEQHAALGVDLDLGHARA
jgi:hypothetical protein